MSPTTPTPTKGETLRVRGTVRDQYGRPLAGIQVSALDRDLRNSQRLGVTKTDEAGTYKINYSREQFAKAEKDLADLVVIIGDPKDPSYASKIHFNAAADLVHDVQLGGAAYRGPSAWDLLTESLTPLLEGINPRDLREDDKHQDVSFLSGESGRSPLAIGTWLTCFHLTAWAEEAKLNLPPSFLYAYLRQGQPALLYDDLLADLKQPERIPVLLEKIMRQLTELGEARHRALFEAAVEENFVPADLAENVARYYQAFESLRLRFAGEATHGAGKGTLSDLFTLTGLPQEQQGGRT